MKTIHYIRLLLRNAAWVILVPVVCAATVYWLTRNMRHEYISTTTMYTGVASGYSITSDDEPRIDYFAVNNAFDNLLATAKSRETLEQVALRLLAEDLLLTKPDNKVLGWQGFLDLKQITKDKAFDEARRLTDTQSVYNYLETVYQSKADNPVARVLNSTGSYYSIEAIRSGIVVTRINTSDMIQVVYTCTDPAVCMRTLQLHSDIFISKYKGLKVDQTNSAVEYFESRLKEVKGKLQSSEDELKNFGAQHQVINFYEQTRYIAESKEEVDKEIYRMKEERDASQRALKLVESKLNSREKQITNSTNLINLRQHLAKVNADIEVATVYNNTAKAEQLSALRTTIEDSIKGEAIRYNDLGYSLETVPRTDLISEWVNNALNYDKANSNIDVLTNTRGDYLNEYKEFSPLGSTIKRLDRQIDINEQEFLSILHGLNLARLRQSSISLSSNIAVIDSPFFPLQAQASKRGILVASAFIASLLIVLSFIIGRSLLDSSLRTPDRAKKIIGLPLAGVSLADKKSKRGDVYKQNLSFTLTEQLVNALLPSVTKAIEDKGQAQVSLITTRQDVYRSADIQLLHEQLEALYEDVFWIVPEKGGEIFSAVLPYNSFSVYQPNISQLNYKSISSLAETDITENRLIVYVTPPLSGHSLPTAIVKSSAAGVIVCNACHTWQDADREALRKTRDIDRNTPFYTWLINTSEENIDSLVGEVPKKRSWLRRKVKKAATLNLNRNVIRYKCMSVKREHIICFALPAWQADYLRSTVELMKCLSKNNLVLYVDYAYTLSDCFKAMWGHSKMEWMRVLGLKKRLRRISGDDGSGLYLLSLPPVFPSFLFSSFKSFDKANQINAAFTGYFINKAVKKLGMKDIVGFNAFQPFLGRWWKIKHQTFNIYYCYDDFINVPYFKGFAEKSEKDFISKMNLLIVTSDELKKRKQQANIPAEVVYNGVHFDSFNQYVKPVDTEPGKQKTVGYTGSIDNRIDIDLLEPVVKKLSHLRFVFIGKVFDNRIYDRLSVYSNVHFLPPVSSGDIPALMSNMQVGIIPYKINSLTRAIYPLKANEYLAMGLPVVMTPFASIGEADEVVCRAATAETFTAGICQSLEQNTSALQQDRIRIAKKADWATRAQQLLSIIQTYKAEKTTVHVPTVLFVKNSLS